MAQNFSLGEWVRQRRKALDLTQAALAHRVGCAVSTVRKIEADERRPSRQIALLLATALEIPANERAQFLQVARAELVVDQLSALAVKLPAVARAPAMMRPTGTVTFVFTDIEGSSRLWEQHPAAMQKALARHDAILRTTMIAHAGTLVKGTGDGFHSAFTRATDAAAAALAAQRALSAENWGMLGALRVRMALHTGVAEERDGDYFGTAVNRAARLLAVAHGGQILLSRATYEVVRDHLPLDATLHDLGTHRLKDLSRAEQVFQLSTLDLRADFPPLASLTIRYHNLPVQLTSFVGRERELVEVMRQLELTRLLTLTGPGGTGKTRLSLQVAAALLAKTGRFPDGVWLIELAPLADPALVPQAVATSLGLREDAGRPVLAILVDFLRAKALLLILDNCEHVVDACAQFAETMLHACPDLHILASSREALGIAGEVAWRVPPLEVPTASGEREMEHDWDVLRRSEAVRLFVERAVAARPGFTLTSQNAGAVVQVCQQLDGIPLAIELAAARVRVLAVEQIAARLDNRFQLLTGGMRTALPRHQTLQALIDWSYDLLTSQEQVLLRRLAVFAGGWTLEAAEVVTGIETRNQARAADNAVLDVLEGLAHLVDKSLVIAEEQYGAIRYAMLETIRAYALERLRASGETEALLRQHAAYFLKIVERVAPWDTDQLGWLDYLEREHSNLRAVFTWSLAGYDQQGIGLRVASGLEEFWRLHSHLREGIMWLDRLLSQPITSSPVVRARALLVAGMLAENHSEFRRATTWLEQSVALYRNLDDPARIAEALMYLGRCKYWQAEYAEAQPLLLKALSQFKAQADGRLIMWALISIGDCLFYSNSVLIAQDYFQNGLVLAQQQEDPFGSAWASTCLGRVAHALGDLQMAQLYLDRAMPIFHEIGITSDVAHVLLEQGRVAEAQGLVTQAHRYYAESLALFARQRMQRVPECLEGIAGLAADQQPTHTAQLLSAATAIRESVNVPLPPVYRASYERTVAAARDRLGEAAYVAAWAAGQVLTLEQAIAQALCVAPAA